MDDDLIPDPELPEIRIPREHERSMLICPDHGPTVVANNEACPLPDAYCQIDQPHCSVVGCARTDVARGVSRPHYVYSSQEHLLADVEPFDSWSGHRPQEDDDDRWTAFHVDCGSKCQNEKHTHCGQPSNASEAWDSEGWFGHEDQASPRLHESVT
jgi:hypothetical protein